MRNLFRRLGGTAADAEGQPSAEDRLRAWIDRAEGLALRRLDDQRMIERLVRSGCPTAVARRIVVLAPIAFGRGIVGPLGVRTWPDIEIAADSGRHETRPLAAFPEFRLAAALAEGDGFKAYTGLALRSAEVNAVNRLLRDGSKAADIVLPQPLTTLDLLADG